jgi:hypothetical protein
LAFFVLCLSRPLKPQNKFETVVRNFVISNPSSLLLLDKAQLFQLAGDTQCVAKQNQFDTLNLVTKLDSTSKTWTIAGQVENRAVSKIQRNVQAIAYFYDSKGNNIGGPYKGAVNSTVLKSLQIRCIYYETKYIYYERNTYLSQTRIPK